MAEKKEQDTDTSQQGQVNEPAGEETAALKKPAQADNTVQNAAGPQAQNTNQSQTTDRPPLLQWRAPEFTQEKKSLTWYMALAGVSIVVLVLSLGGVYLFGDPSVFDYVITSLVVLSATAAVGVMGQRQPELAEFQIDDAGITIDDQFFPFDAFQSAAFITDSQLPTVELEPTRRFSPHIGLTLTEDIADQAVDIISVRLPFEQRELDSIDRLSRYLKF